VSASDGNTGNWTRAQRLIVADIPIYLIAASLLAFCVALFVAYDIAMGVGGIQSNFRLYAVSAAAMLVVDMTLLLARHKPASPIAFLIGTFRRRVRDPLFVARLPLFAIAVVFMPFFSQLKSMIPLFNAFQWDPAFIAWDRALFVGFDAWQVLQPVFGYPQITALLAVLYHAWMLLIYVGTLLLLFHPAATSVARQYFLGFILIWTLIGGGWRRCSPRWDPASSARSSAIRRSTRRWPTFAPRTSRFPS